MNKSKRFWGGALLASMMSVSGGAAAQTSQGTYQAPVAVETESFGETSFALGTLSSKTGALPRDLWQGTSVETLDYLLGQVPVRYSEPAMLRVMQRALLSPADAPAGSTDALTAKKLMILARAGFYEDAASIAELARGLSGEPELSQVVAYAELMRGDVLGACQRNAGLDSGRNQPFWLKLRLICYKTTGETAAADLTLGLMRERGLLSPAEDKLFGAMVSGVALGGDIRPVTGFEYAAIRQLQLGIDLSSLKQAEGAVLRALATEVKAPQQARVLAAEQAVRLGILSVKEMEALFTSFTFASERKAQAKDLMAQNRQNYLIDPLVYQAALEMTAPEFALDRDALIGEALRGAGSETRFIALAKLYAPLISNIQMVENYAPYAREFALAGIVSQDISLAQKWLLALSQQQTNTAKDATSRLLRLMSIQYPEDAAALASQLDITLPSINRAALARVETGQGVAAEELARIVNLGFDATAQKIRGQSALVALAASGLEIKDELTDLRNVILLQTLYAAGLGNAVADLAFDHVLSEELPQVIKLASANLVSQNKTVAPKPKGPRKINGIAIPRVKP